jgi:hypothetical protein
MGIENGGLEISHPILRGYQKTWANQEHDRNFFHFYLLYAVIQALSVLKYQRRHLLSHEAIYFCFPTGGRVSLTGVPKMVVSR